MFEINNNEIPECTTKRLIFSVADKREDGIYALVSIPTLVHCPEKLLSDLDDMILFAENKYSAGREFTPAAEKMIIERITPPFVQSGIRSVRIVKLSHPIYGTKDPKKILNFASMMRVRTVEQCNDFVGDFEDEPVKDVLEAMSSYYTPSGIKRIIRMERAVVLASGQLTVNSPGCFINLSTEKKYPKAYSYPEPEELMLVRNAPEKFVIFQTIYEYKMLERHDTHVETEEALRKLTADIRKLEETLYKVASVLESITPIPLRVGVVD